MGRKVIMACAFVSGFAVVAGVIAIGAILEADRRGMRNAFLSDCSGAQPLYACIAQWQVLSREGGR